MLVAGLATAVLPSLANGQSATAPLVTTATSIEGAPHVSSWVGDFGAHVVAMTTGPSQAQFTPGWEVLRADLDERCPERILMRVTDDDSLVAGLPADAAVQAHPSVSGNGRAIAWASALSATASRGTYALRWADLDLTQGQPITLETVRVVTAPPNRETTGPRTTLSASRGKLFFMREMGTSGVNEVAVLDPIQPSNVRSLGGTNGLLEIAVTQSPTNSDGTRLAGLGLSTVPFVRAWVRLLDDIACGPTTCSYTVRNIAWEPITLTAAQSARDVTYGDDIDMGGTRHRMLAWSSMYDYHSNSLGSVRSLWIWRERNIPFAAADPELTMQQRPWLGGQLIRLRMASLQDIERPAISGEAYNVVFVAGGRLYQVSLPAPGSPSPVELTQLSNEPAATVLMASTNIVGSMTAYSVRDASGNVDVRIAGLAAPATPSADPDPRPAHLPFEASLSCRVEPFMNGSRLEETLTLRQFNGGPRNLTLMFDAWCGSDDPIVSEPRVQPLGDGETVTVERSMFLSCAPGQAPRGRVRILDGSQVQLDVVEATCF